MEYRYYPSSSDYDLLDGAVEADPYSTARVGEDTYFGPVWRDRRGLYFVVLRDRQYAVRYDVGVGRWRV